MKDLKDLLGKKKAIDPMAKEAKLEALKDMKKAASEVMGDKLNSAKMKKVSVIAPDEDSLKEGLEAAEDILESKALPMGEESEDEEMEMEAESPEEIDKLIEMLQAKKAKLLSE